MKHHIFGICVLSVFAAFTVLCPDGYKNKIGDITGPNATLTSKLEKISSLSKSGNTLDADNVNRLLDYLSKCDVELIIPIANLITKYKKDEGADKIIQDTLTKRIESDSIDTDNALDICDYLLDNIISANGSRQDAATKQLTEVILRRMGKSGGGDVNKFITSPVFEILRTFNGKDCAIFLCQQLERDDSNVKSEILKLFNDNELRYYITEKELPQIVALTGNQDAELSRISGEIIKSIVHLHTKKDIPVGSWTAWWKDNKNSFTILENAQETLRKKDSDPISKKNALYQILLSGYSNSFIMNDNLDIAILITDDDDVPLDIRKEIFQTLAFMHFKKNNEKIAGMFNKAFKNDKMKSVAVNLFSYAPSFLHNDDEIRIYLINMISNKKEDIRDRGAATYNLRKFRSNKKDNALSILNFIKSEYDGNEPKKPIRLAFMGLAAIVGKDCGKDLKAWEKAVSEMPDDPPEEEPKGESKK
jgi:hypothetical protein